MKFPGRKFYLAGVAALGCLAAGLAAPSAAAASEQLTLGATNANSSNFTIAVAMSKAIEAGMPDSKVTVIETGASIDNIRRMARGEVDFGLVSGDTAIQAIEGTGPFEGRPAEDLVALYSYSTIVLNLSVRADSGVATLEDLSGKKFNPGIRGSGTEATTVQLFSLFDVEPDYVFGTINDALEGIQNNQVVGYSKYGSYGSIDSSLQQLLATTDMRILDFPKEKQEKVLANLKGIGFQTVPAGLFPGQPEFTAPVIHVVYATRKGLMDDETAYGIARSINEQRQFLEEAWPHLKTYDFVASARDAEKQGIAFHPGAKRYWDDQP